MMRCAGDAGRCDAVFVPAFNQLTGPVARWLAVRHGKPVLLDYMVGLSDGHEERGVVSRPRRAVYRAVDRFNIARPATMTDTQAHRAYFAASLGVDTGLMHVVPVGVRQVLCDAQPAIPPPGPFVAQYLGTYIPFHGVETILRAAERLEHEGTIRFELIGGGQTYPAARRLAAERGLTNVTFIEGHFDPPALFEIARRASAFLGVFGDTAKTRYVVPTKVYEGLAMGRPVVTADSPAIREFLTPGEHLVTVPPNYPARLAEAVARLAGSPAECAGLAARGRRHVEECLSPSRIGRQVKEILERLHP
jgi:glycosyltransferase involved in cell wall biosynthesis